MDVKATMKFVRISPTKARDLARKIQGMPVADALNAMQFTRRKAATLILKTLKSAVANAENNAKLSAENLRVKEAVVENGPTMKRFRPRARGGASRILKRSSHIRIVLADNEVPTDAAGVERSS
jgi:large subunit ribosomal protein L22